MPVSTGTHVCSRAQAEQLVDDLTAAFGGRPGDFVLMDEGFDDRQWTIVGEAFDEWTVRVEGRVTPPPGTFLEPVTYCQLAICLI
ncbi:hypothetical protein ACFOWE_17905 [Planomonospora corallina]|uniref:Uncharacterized protein n=1 Tax=Planomonospora corallina TaxID=1806052 RepID=A0ABV8I7K2_9ACTN